MKYLLVGLLLATTAHAGIDEEAEMLSDLTGLDLQAGIHYSQYSDDASSDTTFAGRIGLDEFPVYLFAGFEQPKARLLGQPMGDTDIFTVGLGVKVDLAPKLRGFIEFGYASVDLVNNPAVVSEVAYSYLVGRHAAVGQNHLGEDTSRRIPVSGGPYDEYDTQYTLDDGFLGRIGVGYKLHNNLSVTVSYKVLVVDEYIALKDQEVIQETGGWWEESNTRDFNAFEIGLFLTY